jgi:pimeloyl-ACP methyl ester carboxylesterase
MYMAGLNDEAQFDEFAKTLSWEGHAEKLRMPYLCVTGEYDNHSPLIYTENLIKAIPGPRILVIYQGAAHSVSGTPATNLGPYFPTLMADWMAEILAGGNCPSERWYVDNGGRVNKKPL